jgi:hypothetical protein
MKKTIALFLYLATIVIVFCATLFITRMIYAVTEPNCPQHTFALFTQQMKFRCVRYEDPQS